MYNRTILVVDDEMDILEMIQSIFIRAGFTNILTAVSGREALKIWSDAQPDMVILDIMMPKMDGWEVCREIRQYSQVPIVMLTAKSGEKDELLGFELGVDDYVVKPFDLAVLYSRLLALLRRTKTVTDTKLFCDDLMLDKEKTAVYDGQKEIVVSQPEYRILLILMENKGKTITRNQLLEQVWDRSGNYVNDNTLTVTMKRLREKLNHPACLKTIRSFGYRMEDTQ